MAHKIVADVAHGPENPRLGPRRRRASRTGRSPRRSSSAVARRRGLGQAQPGAAGRAARGGCGRRGRLRADDHLRRRRRRPARRGAADARPPRAGAHHPPRAQLRHLPLLHELRRHRQRPEPHPLHRPAGRARRLGAGGGRRDDAEGAPAHRRARARHRRVRRAGEVSHLDVADMREQVPNGTAPGRRPGARRGPGRRGIGHAAGRGGVRCAAAPSRWSAARGCAELFASSACTRSTAARR